MIKEVVILNEKEVQSYIDYSMSKNDTNVCKIDKIKNDIKSGYEKCGIVDCGTYGNFQSECFPDWDKVHCFAFVGVYNGYLIAHYNGALK